MPLRSLNPISRCPTSLYLDLARACCEMSRRDGMIVAWHEVPLEIGHFTQGLSPGGTV
jgi:hypothetical protein